MRGWFKLALWAIGLWFFFAVFTPVVEPLIPAWQRYNQLQEAQNHDSGALYYTNVPVTSEAEAHLRQAVKEGMQQRLRSK